MTMPIKQNISIKYSFLTGKWLGTGGCSIHDPYYSGLDGDAGFFFTGVIIIFFIIKAFNSKDDVHYYCASICSLFIILTIFCFITLQELSVHFALKEEKEEREGEKKCAV
ncbi:hypothetical protein ACJX0J_011339 [Zea mays]